MMETIHQRKAKRLKDEQERNARKAVAAPVEEVKEETPKKRRKAKEGDE